MKGEVKKADLSSLSREALTGVNNRGQTTGKTQGPVWGGFQEQPSSYLANLLWRSVLRLGSCQGGCCVWGACVWFWVCVCVSGCVCVGVCLCLCRGMWVCLGGVFVWVCLTVTFNPWAVD